MLHEMAKLNLREDSNSKFPSDKYRIWVQTDTSLSKVPYVYISSQKDNWELKVHIETCEIIGVINKGDKESDNPKQFQEEIEKLKQWFTLQTTMPGRIGSNKDSAFNEWIACNEEF